MGPAEGTHFTPLLSCDPEIPNFIYAMRLKAALLPLLLAPSLALRAAPVPTTRLRSHHVQQHAPALVMRRSTASPRMVALPMCPAGGVLSLAVKAGCATVLAQLGLVAAFRSSSDPVLKQAPGYAAHQLVALAVMLYAYATEDSNPGLAAPRQACYSHA